MTDTTENLFGRTEADLRDALAPWTDRPFHAGQLFHWIYGRGETDFAAMTDLPRALRASLAERFRIEPPAVARVIRARDGTTKYAIRLADGEEIETVLIPEGGRRTLCVSSQVGCALGCRFCLTAQMGLRRNLTAGEIVGQVWLLRREPELAGRSFNIVLMGMGEPMQNLDAVMEALGILADPRSVAVPMRRVMLSTAGHLPGILRLAQYERRPRLALSLTATTDPQRDRLMPINRKWPIAELLAALREFPFAPRERLTIEYVLLAGVNDSMSDAGRLAHHLRPLPAKVNLIRYNRTDQGDFAPPPEKQVRAFRDRLLELGTAVSIRKRKGEEIFAACGQLALRAPEPGATVDGAEERRAAERNR